jgi:hypothetical protein
MPSVAAYSFDASARVARRAPRHPLRRRHGCAYQLIVFRWIHPVELVVVVLLLAFVPYLLIRGPVNRLARTARKTGA